MQCVYILMLLHVTQEYWIENTAKVGVKLSGRRYHIIQRAIFLHQRPLQETGLTCTLDKTCMTAICFALSLCTRIWILMETHYPMTIASIISAVTLITSVQYHWLAEQTD